MFDERILAQVNAIRATARLERLSLGELEVLMKEGGEPSDVIGRLSDALGYRVARSQDGTRTYVLYNRHELTAPLLAAIGGSAVYWDKRNNPRAPEDYQGFAVRVPSAIASLAALHTA